MSSFFSSLVKYFIDWLKRLWFESKLKARLDMIELQNRVESELELEKQNKPIYIEHPIDPVLQPGESAKLGGAIELKAPWYTDEPQPPKSDGMP